jgi:DNA-directed RNA polymerase II subunit RPB2
VKIFLDGSWLLNTEEHPAFLARMRYLRREGKLSHQISFSYQPTDKEVHIYTDSGRMMRPLLVV